MKSKINLSRKIFLPLFFFLFLPILVSSPLQVSPQHINVEVDIGAVAQGQNIEIRFTSQDRINYSVSSRTSWITVQPVRGTLRTNQRNRHQVRLNTRNLRAGLHTGRIEIRSQALPRPVQVEVSVNVRERVEIQVQPRSIQKTIYPGERVGDIPFTVSSTSRQPTQYQMRSNVHWLRVSPSYGTAYSSRQQRHRIIMSTQNMRQGNYQGRITVNSPSAVNSPVEIPVNITIHDVPPLEVSPHFIRHRIRRNQRLQNETLTIRNESRETINYRVTTNTYWLKVYPYQGRIGPQRVQYLSVEYDISRLNPGTHRASINIESPGIPHSRKEIPVELRIEHQDVLRIEPVELRYSVPYNQERGFVRITIQNLVHDSINFTVRTSSPWMRIQPQRGWVYPRQQRQLEVQFYFTSMFYGTNYGYIDFDFPEYYEESIQIPVTINRQHPK